MQSIRFASQSLFRNSVSTKAFSTSVRACTAASTQTHSESAEVSCSDEALFALGVLLSKQSFGKLRPLLKGDEIEKVAKGVSSEMLLDPAATSINPMEFQEQFNTLLQGRMIEHEKMIKTQGLAYLEAAAKEEGVVKTDSGLLFKELSKGTGESKPTATSKVKVHYVGTLIDGTVFDSSVARGQPAEFGLNQVIPGWTEGLQLMTEGSKAKMILPSELAYGDKPAGSIPPNSVLMFDVELMEILEK